MSTYRKSDIPDDLQEFFEPVEIGLEETLDDYVAKMVEVFRAVWRVLRDDGTLWLNLGDSYNAYNHNRGPAAGANKNHHKTMPSADRGLTSGGLKPKDLMGIPWRVALALQADGWYLRSDIIWHKPSPMPESVTDRPTKSHEYLFLLTKKPRYFYDAEAVKEAATYAGKVVGLGEKSMSRGQAAGMNREPSGNGKAKEYHVPAGRNLRDVWTVASKNYKGAHFATFPPKLIEPCIKAGTSEEGCCPECGAPWERITEKNRVATRPALDNVNDPTGMANRDPERHVTTTKTTGWKRSCKCGVEHGEPEYQPIPCTVLDPFMGSGTTAEVARSNGCHAIGCELSAEYIELAADRLRQGTLF